MERASDMDTNSTLHGPRAASPLLNAESVPLNLAQCSDVDIIEFQEEGEVVTIHGSHPTPLSGSRDDGRLTIRPFTLFLHHTHRSGNSAFDVIGVVAAKIRLMCSSNAHRWPGVMKVDCSTGKFPELWHIPLPSLFLLIRFFASLARSIPTAAQNPHLSAGTIAQLVQRSECPDGCNEAERITRGLIDRARKLAGGSGGGGGGDGGGECTQHYY